MKHFVKARRTVGTIATNPQRQSKKGWHQKGQCQITLLQREVKYTVSA